MSFVCCWSDKILSSLYIAPLFCVSNRIFNDFQNISLLMKSLNFSLGKKSHSSCLIFDNIWSKNYNECFKTVALKSEIELKSSSKTPWIVFCALFISFHNIRLSVIQDRIVKKIRVQTLGHLRRGHFVPRFSCDNHNPSFYCHLFTNRQVLHQLLEITK